LDKSGDTITLLNTKMKDAEPPAAIAFNLESIDLGDGISSAVLIETEVRHNTKVLSSHQKLAMNTFCEAAVQSWDGEGEFAGLSSEPWRKIFYDKHESGNIETQRRAFSRCTKALVECGWLTFKDGIYRPTDMATFLVTMHQQKKIHQRDMRDIA
jgi:hypothetical protein